MDDTFHQLFVARSHYLPLHIGSHDSRTGSRIGGEAPLCFAEAPICTACGRPLNYYLTLASDIWQAISSTTQSISLFYCADFDCLLYSQSVYALWHADAPRHTSAWPSNNQIEGRALVAGALLEEVTEPYTAESMSKIGGTPALIQWGRLDSFTALAQQNWHFAFQFDEESYPRGFKIERYVFGAGACYAYFGREETNGRFSAIAPQMLWQNS